ncbi:hypothetical protein [Dysgonomonas termitidis]|uniref:DUF5681 domain-containing protein n=1 Tax=Dysgonomonas termitidis TaxID=1516126 RepID=A0ABV9L4H9_9BACT
MAGVKGKSGLKKGTTNNPNGRPRGSANLLGRELRDTLIGRLTKEDIINKIMDDILALQDPADRLNHLKNLYPYIFPRPLADEEKSALNTQSVLFKRLSQPDEE